MKKVKLEIVSPENNSEGIQPILACFPQNIPQTELAKEQGLNFQLYENLINSDQKMLVGESELFHYIGKNFGDYSQKNSYLNNYIGIEEGNKMKLYKVLGNFNLKQKLKANANEKIEEGVEDSITKNMSIFEQKQNLVEAFGTKKSRKKIMQQQNSIVKVSNISQSEQITELFKEKGLEMEKKVEEEGVLKSKDFLDQKKSFLPQFNLATEIPEQIYNISSIVSKEELSLCKVQSFIQLIKNPSELLKYKEQFHPYAYTLLEQFSQEAVKVKITKPMVLKLKYVWYLNVMLKFVKINLVQKSIEDLSFKLNIDLTLITHILKKFYQLVPQQNTPYSKYSRSTLLFDKYICYLIILTLAIHDYKITNAQELSVALKLDRQRFLTYCNQIGCSLHTQNNKEADSNHITVTLNAPLKFTEVTAKKFTKKGN